MQGRIVNEKHIPVDLITWERKLSTLESNVVINDYDDSAITMLDMSGI